MPTNVSDPTFLPLDDAPSEWDEATLPVRVREPHETPPEVWTRYTVRHGEIRFTTWAPRRRSAILQTGQSVMLPPPIKHALSPVGPVRLSIQRFTAEPGEAWVFSCPVCRGILETGTNHDGCRTSPDYPGKRQRRFYARPRPGESGGDVSERFTDGVLAMIAEHRRAHPEFFEGDGEPASDSPTVVEE